jgi:hypothetical protein
MNPQEPSILNCMDIENAYYFNKTEVNDPKIYPGPFVPFAHTHTPILLS